MTCRNPYIVYSSAETRCCLILNLVLGIYSKLNSELAKTYPDLSFESFNNYYHNESQNKRHDTSKYKLANSFTLPPAYKLYNYYRTRNLQTCFHTIGMLIIIFLYIFWLKKMNAGVIIIQIIGKF